jgi:hypothetical protein
MENLVMRKPVGKSATSKKLSLTDPSVSNGGPVYSIHRAAAAHLDGKRNRQTVRSASEGSHFFKGEPGMRNRLQVSFWGLHLDAQGVIGIAAALLIVLVFAVLLTIHF